VRSVGFLLIPGFALLSYAAAVEPLRAANQLAGRTLYRWWHTTPAGKAATASNGAAVLTDLEFGSDARDLDLMLVCAGGNPVAFDDRRTFLWLRRLAGQGVTLGGISGGPVILAKAGLLRGRRCTVHWEHAPALQERDRQIQLTHSLFELDGDRITCSGGIAGLDMMVALIARDHGYDLGAAVSEWFLHTHVREGVTPNRMDLRSRLGIAEDVIVGALRAMESHLETPLTRERLARSAGVSLRALERAFRRHLGTGIHEHYLILRLKRARQLLRETSLSILEIALATGFGSSSQFSRAFRARYGETPREARQRDRPQPRSKAAV
jgi:transcriptional regulator GlxA family with amidase domain